ncbi:MAG: SEC-C metal-binding domain-containing protein [Longimicrobiales bacterium]|nr:SEC-C metal-binding domain-containing protein [Longimicrobiales bacterium]
MLVNLMADLRKTVVQFFFLAQFGPALPQRRPRPQRLAGWRGWPQGPGRKDPCPCGSGKKYMKCHWR